MNRPPDTELIVNVARDVVEQVAPDELSYYPAISAAYKRNPNDLLKQLVEKDDELGFGVGETVQALAPTILLIVEQAVAQMSSDATQKGVGIFFRHSRKKLLKRRSTGQQTNKPGSLENTLADIRDNAFKTAREFDIEEAKANQIADSLIGKLALIREVKTEKK